MTKVKDIMTEDPMTVSPTTSVRDLAVSLIEKNYTGAPVVDEDGTLVGVVTESDLIYQHKNLHLPTVITLFDSVLTLGGSHELETQIKKMLGSEVADIMTKEILSVDEETSLDDVATIMSEKGKHYLPVLRAEKLVGVVDRSDVVRAIIKEN
ncbi:CBS domain protein sometimes clustered with YjeE [hydrothermal vent metagenome]|uniref:CBS domain protein sometimes clustered with YjeE n=1 Tax=hydrothermal vent metagenome TaxID=652676 RepID=A0A3B1BWE6_9ZZZZ